MFSVPAIVCFEDSSLASIALDTTPRVGTKFQRAVEPYVRCSKAGDLASDLIWSLARDTWQEMPSCQMRLAKSAAMFLLFRLVIWPPDLRARRSSKANIYDLACRFGGERASRNFVVYSQIANGPQTWTFQILVQVVIEALVPRKTTCTRVHP